MRRSGNARAKSRKVASSSCLYNVANREKGKQAEKRVITRRSFIVGAAALAGLMMWNPRMAFADEPWWDGSLIFRGYGNKYDSKFWSAIGSLESGNGGAQSETMYTDRWVSAKTPWVEWDISSNQYIRTASKITMRCDFTTELYHHVTGLLEIACGSYNGRNASYNLWHTDSGDDTRFSLYHAVNDLPEGGALEESKVVVIDNEVGGGIHKDGAHVWTDYRAYPQNSYSVWIRRSAQAVKHSFQLRSWFWNYYYFGTNWYYDRSSDPPIGYSTKWIEQYSDAIYISSNAAWGNRIVALSPRSSEGSCMESADAPAAGSVCRLAAHANATRQHWIVSENESGDVGGTYRFTPVTSSDGAFQLDQTGGGPTMSAAPAQLWHASRGSVNRAQAFWLHGSSPTQWLFCDCSGMALDCGDSAGVARFHSNGYPAGEWSNEDHQWCLQDARVSSADGFAFSLQGASENGEVQPGEVLEAPHAPGAFNPSGSGIRYEYTWLVSDGELSGNEYPEVMGVAHMQRAGVLDEQPGVNLIGMLHGNDSLSGLSLCLEGCSLPGSVAVQLYSEGLWQNGASTETAAKRLSVSLQGDASRYYTLRYRVCSSGLGWGTWVSEGDEAAPPGSAVSGVQIRVEPKEVVLQGSQTFLEVDEAWLGKYLQCVVRAYALYCDVPYRGAALSQSCLVGGACTTVRYIADGDPSPCFEERVRQETAYVPSQTALSLGQKPGCSRFDGWYTDATYETPFEPGTLAQGDVLTLYGRSVAHVRYELSKAAQMLFDTYECHSDSDLSAVVHGQDLLPEGEEVAYGTRLRFGRRASVWYEERGRAREALSVAGAFLDADELTPAVEVLKVVNDVVVYISWHTQEYEGIAVS